MSLSKKSKILFSILFLVVLTGGIAFYYATVAPTKIESKEVEFNGTSDDFLIKINENSRIWQDKVIVLQGDITSKDGKGVTLSSQIYCQFREDVDFSNIKNNKKIKLKGRVIGYDDLLEELKLDQCIIQK